MKLVFIYGPPGAGKLSVARELCEATGFKLFHNHMTIALVEPFFEFGTQPFGRLVGKFRLDIMEEAAKEKLDGLVFTFVYAHPEDEGFVKQAVEVVGRHGGEVCFVRLFCEQAELERRVLSGTRKEQRKVATVELLREVMARYDLLSPVSGRESLTLDNTLLPPREAAEKIAAHFRLNTAARSER